MTYVSFRYHLIENTDVDHSQRFGEFSQDLVEVKSDGRVQTSNGIIPASHSSVGSENFCQRDSLPFTSRNTADKLVADYDRVSELTQKLE